MIEDYEVVIGLEIHAEQNTKSKIFCCCENTFGGAPNTHCCPVCVALPGALPVINKMAIKNTIKAGLAVGCSINDVAVFERKSYFYPDLAKAYQISQLEKPICLGGGIKLDCGKFIRLNRIHLEEDAGKLIHNENVGSLVDYNRAGVPLMEIVTEPDLSNADEVYEFVTKLRANLIYSDVAECKMEEGGMRCDVNLSMIKKGQPRLSGKRTEMKNLNSFKMIGKAIESEINRQSKLLDAGGKVVQETRRWNDAAGVSESLRSKENSDDYRYFPDPDILAIKISSDDVEKIRVTLPEMPTVLKERFVESYGIPAYDADVILKDKEVCQFYVKAVEIFNEPKKISNFLMTTILAKVKNTDDGKISLTPKQCADIVQLVSENKISRANGVLLMEEIWGNDSNVFTLAKEKNMLNDIDENAVLQFVQTVLAQNSSAMIQYAETPDKILNFLTGCVMKLSKGKADSKLVKELLEKELKK